MFHTDAVVVLETMWGNPKNIAPGFFHISKYNHSGSRLHYLLEGYKFLVTNACREVVDSPDKHGTPDPERLSRNLQRLKYDILIVAGVIAWKTYLKCNYVPQCTVLKMKHPAVRNWCLAEVKRYQQYIKGVLDGCKKSS